MGREEREVLGVGSERGREGGRVGDGKDEEGRKRERMGESKRAREREREEERGSQVHEHSHEPAPGLAQALKAGAAIQKESASPDLSEAEPRPFGG